MRFQAILLNSSYLYPITVKWLKYFHYDNMAIFQFLSAYSNLLQRKFYRERSGVLTAGGDIISSLTALITSLCSVTESSAQPLCALVTSCLIAVKNPGIKVNE